MYKRQFLYFVVGYYFAYALLLIAGCVRLAKGGEKSAALVRVKNLVLFGLASVVAMVILLWPMVSHILAYNYAGRYSYYNGGGLALEAFYHIGRMGLFNILLMVLGLAFAAKHRAPSLPCLAGCELVVSILLFTRVQNTGSHQFLLFLPGYFILFLLGAAALAEGGFTPADLGHLNAHGTGTPANDATESKALANLMGGVEAAASVPVTSVKGTTGHMLGAAGAVEAIVCALSVARDAVPPTAGFAEAAEDCPVAVVTEAVTDYPQKVALSTSLGFGGHNAALAFSPYKG